MLHEIALFLRHAVASPANIGAVVPSSRELGDLVARGLGPDTGRVIEIGPGTGSLTKGMLRAGVREQDLTLVELNPSFCTHLRRKFPRARVINAGAEDIGAQDMDGLESGHISHVISGLPLLNFPASLQSSILEAAFSQLAPDGKFVQFTYGFQPPIDAAVRATMDLGWHMRGRVWANLPPASVYEFYRNAPH